MISHLSQPSSWVKGRNGQLALHHRILQRLSDLKLSSLIVLHKDYTKRLDEATAAERYLGAKPRDLFVYWLGQLALPRRPTAKRFEPKQKSLCYLDCIAMAETMTMAEFQMDANNRRKRPALARRQAQLREA